MKRVALFLIVCATVTAVVLAIGLVRDRTSTPAIVARFIEKTWEGSDLGPPGVYVTTDFVQNRGQTETMEHVKRYSYLLGPFVNIREELERPVNELDRMEVVLQLEFEKGDAVCRVRLVRAVEGNWLIDDIGFDMDEALERAPRIEPVVTNGKLHVESFLKGSAEHLWKALSDEEQQRRDWRGFRARSEQIPEVLGGLETVEVVGEPEWKDKNTVFVRWHGVGDSGKADIETTWKYRDVFWYVSRLDVDIRSDD